MSTRSVFSLLAFALVALGSSLGCADDFMLERTQKNMAKLHSFHGVLTETGVLDSGEMKSELWWKRPNLFLSRVLAPASYAGVTLAYDGKKLVIYYPMANYAIELDNLSSNLPEDDKVLIAAAYRHNQASFRYSLGGGSSVAKLPTISMDYTAKKKGYVHPSGSVQVYDKYSFTLAGNLSFPESKKYSYRYDEMKFEEPIADAAVTLTLPKNAIVSRWDLASTGLPELEMREQAHFDLALPKLPEEWKLERIVRQEGPVPAFSLVYRRGPHYVVLSMWKDLGVRPVSEAHGVPIALHGHRGRIVIGPVISSYTTALRGTMYVFTSNVPFDELLTLADTLK